MFYGYAGEVLNIDLTHGKVGQEHLVESETRKYIGGPGLSAKLIWDKIKADTHALSPENPLIFMTGPLTGTPVPSANRYSVAALSPLTGIWGEAHAGGTWGQQLKWAGFDGIVLTGRAQTPVYLWICDGEVKILDASHLWGKDTYEVSDILQKETDPRASVASIGRAGERLVKIACIINDGRAGRAAGRCGLGALMGSKNLKGIVVRGTQRPGISDREGLRKSIGNHFPPTIVNEEEWKSHIREWRQEDWRKGRSVVKNFLEGELDGFLDMWTEIILMGEPYYCWGCRDSCLNSMMNNGVRGPMGEALVPLGSQCLINDKEALLKAWDLCQRYGMDSMSAGCVIAFAMEAFEKGLISNKDTNGINLTWGNHEAMVEMVRKIGEKEGFGEILGEGPKAAADHIGGVASEYAMHVKGLSIPRMDPRAADGFALEYATGSRGADHLEAYYIQSGRGPIPDLGIYQSVDTVEKRFSPEGQAEIVAKLQNYVAQLDSLGVCKFLTGFSRSRQIVQPSHLVEWLNYVTGWNMTLEEFLKTGERVFNLKRLFNIQRGISRKDDLLPARIMTHKKGGKSEAAEHVPSLGRMLGDYYSYRGWSEDGIPTREKLIELGLSDLIHHKKIGITL